ncbi:hypothetical protein ANCCEY_14778 [Ancylostoma ceylanicum]|uniref:Uncharacterized protein n=1 Tax=Ancylostoma ceylanicum TaxID=53326 RepID=A0A0D6LEP4_9BILA|nr:hypothetical protein ANCCEY_14778 [Ancylostoma ceylanicum]
MTLRIAIYGTGEAKRRTDAKEKKVFKVALVGVMRQKTVASMCARIPTRKTILCRQQRDATACHLISMAAPAYIALSYPLLNLHPYSTDYSSKGSLDATIAKTLSPANENDTTSDHENATTGLHSEHMGKLKVSLKTKPPKVAEAQHGRKERKPNVQITQNNLARDVLLIGVIVILSVILVGLVVFGIALLVKGRDRTKKKTSKKKKKERKKKNKGMRR